MSESDNPSIDLPAIERRLRDLWKAAATPGDAEDSQAVIRAGVLNLVVYSPGEGEENAITQSISAITRNHPGRVILLLPSECALAEPGGSVLHTHVSTLCDSLCCGKQICGELITIRCVNDQLRHLPSLVRPLLEADLPHVLWWRGSPAFGFPMFDQLAGDVDRVIVDSSLQPTPTSGIWKPARRILGAGKTIFADLAWSRLEPWRAALAELFDIEKHRRQIGGIERVEIVFKLGNAPNGLSTPAAMTAGWLATRLGRMIEAAPGPTADGVVELRLAGGKDQGVISLYGKEGVVFFNGLKRISLVTPDTTFKVECRDAGHLAAYAGDDWEPRVFPVQDEDEAGLLSRELETRGRDQSFEGMLRLVAESELL